MCRILLAECKWTTDSVGDALVESLRAKAEHVRWGPADCDERFAVYSKSGFVDGLREQLDDSWSLFNVADLDDLLTKA